MMFLKSLFVKFKKKLYNNLEYKDKTMQLKKFEKSWFYPNIRDERIDEQWKQTLSGFNNWKSAFQEIKKSKVKYRFLLQDYV